MTKSERQKKLRDDLGQHCGDLLAILNELSGDTTDEEYVLAKAIDHFIFVQDCKED